MIRRRGFTLIELLVVVAIIALLIAILLPSLGKARKKARTAQCLANARSMGAAAQFYVSDWGDMFPFYGEGNTTHSWTQILMNGGRPGTAGTYAKTGGYGASDQLRVCPEAPRPIDNPPSPSFGTAIYQWANSPWTGARISSSYGINGWIYNAGRSSRGGNFSDFNSLMGLAAVTASTQAPYFYSVTTARDASRVPIFVDANWRHLFPKSTDAAPTSLIDPGPKSLSGPHPLQRACLDRHDKAVNVSFLDGHAQTVKLGDLWTLKWSANWTRGNPQMVR